MLISKQWTDEHQTTEKTGSGRRKVTSACDNGHLLRVALNDRIASSRIPLKANHLQWAHEHRAWHAYLQKVVFSDESRFNLWDHDSRIHVRCSAGECCLPECVIEPHVGPTPGNMNWGVISYHGRSNLLQMKGIPYSNRYVREVVHPEVVPFL
ncbi:transposable element Tc1 transposase [Trichonephila clavipes]|nr:transposable element Tc1 transposase [Trichonephila clavipes]